MLFISFEKGACAVTNSLSASVFMAEVAAINLWFRIHWSGGDDELGWTLITKKDRCPVTKMFFLIIMIRGSLMS